MNKVLLLGSQHGNELLGKQLHNYIKLSRSELLPHITYRVGNPRAYKKGVRFIESDLNRSYTGYTTTYEEQRASKILSFIKKEQFDLVLDLHTTTCIQPPCFIVSHVTPLLKKYIGGSSILNIVEMSHSIVQTSLIGVCPQSISIEVNEHIDNTLLQELCNSIECFLGNVRLGKTRKIYKVSELLRKQDISTQQASKLHNFTKNSAGFYPILVGENSYKKHTDYLGFKAYSVTTIKV